MTRRRVLLLIGSMVAVIALLWVAPAITGPTVDCTNFDQATCDEVWPETVAEAIARGEGPPVPMPVTSVWVSGPNPNCVSYEIRWLFWFGTGAMVLC